MNDNLFKKEKVKYIGNIKQFATVNHYRFNDGPGMNMRAVEVNNSSGIVFTVLPDRGMDISGFSYKGINLSFLTPNSDISPSFYEPEGLGWLRTFNGGLLTTCGLTHFGPSYIEKTNGEHYGLHGRYSNLPAKQFSDNSRWIGDIYYVQLRAIIEEARLFGYKLRLTRTITCKTGEAALSIDDCVENFGEEKSPIMLLYHINIGYPFLCEETEVQIDSVKAEPRDEISKKGFEKRFKAEMPQKGFKEQVFFYKLKSDKMGLAEVKVFNKRLGLILKVEYDSISLPYLTQWKMCGISDYVMGIEPCNAPVLDRNYLKEKKLIQYLLPGKSKKFKLRISVEEV
ncbi:MAG TPA: aldose 1-epimerase family protein [Victivallales bacterium]|nr:aldose 1-epimerase family protein [Victivallales bacterium]